MNVFNNYGLSLLKGNCFLIKVEETCKMCFLTKSPIVFLILETENRKHLVLAFRSLKII